MNWFDIVVLVFVLVSMFVGWRTGILKTAFAVSGLLLGYVLGNSDFFEEIFLNRVEDKNLKVFLSFLVSFTLTMVMARILWTVVRKTLQFVMLGWVDGAIGAALGLIISVLTLSAGTAVIGCKLGISVVLAGMSGSTFGGELVNFSIDIISIWLSLPSC
jgi:uncharacterized membrane protein required for colicin V production